MSRHFNDLYAFRVIAQSGSFTRAAQQLGVSPSALSHAMNALEARLGIKLLNRTTRSVSMTDAGQQLCERIAPLFDAIQTEVFEMGRFREATVGKVRINASENVALNIIYPKLRDFLPQHPELQVELYLNNGNVDIVAERFDLGVRMGSDVAQDMVAIRMAPDFEMVTVATADYLTARGRSQTPQDLAGHTCIGLALNAHEHLLEWYFWQEATEMRANIRYAPVFSSNVLVKMAARDGLGIAWMPSLMVAEDIASGRLVEILRNYRMIYPGAYLYFPKNRHKPAGLQALIEALRWEGA